MLKQSLVLGADMLNNKQALNISHPLACCVHARVLVVHMGVHTTGKLITF